MYAKHHQDAYVCTGWCKKTTWRSLWTTVYIYKCNCRLHACFAVPLTNCFLCNSSLSCVVRSKFILRFRSASVSISSLQRATHIHSIFVKVKQLKGNRPINVDCSAPSQTPAETARPRRERGHEGRSVECLFISQLSPGPNSTARRQKH